MEPPLPGRGRVFEHRRQVGPADVDGTGTAHLDALARWLQDAAFLDIVDAGVTEARAWVVRRTRVEIHQLPVFPERLRLRTFCSALAKSVAERRTSIEGDAGAAVEAVSAWVQIDPETRMPARFSERFLEVYGGSADGRRARSRLQHPGPAESAERLRWAFRVADLDLAGHVNNAAYWQLAEEHLPATAGATALEVEYRAGAGPGPATVLRDGPMLWVLDEHGEIGASIKAEAA